MTQRVVDIVSPCFVPAAALPTPLVADALFGRGGPLSLEIGCGTGGFVLELAQRAPESLFLAIDIYNRGCYKTCSKLDRAGLDNVRVSRIEARELLTRHLPPRSLGAVYINCPDPWPKKRHRKRRLVNRELLELLEQALIPGGELFFVSDFADYAADVAALIETLPGWVNSLEARIAPSLPGYPLSKYMRRYLEGGEPLFFLCASTSHSGCPEPRHLDGPPPRPAAIWDDAAND